MRDPEYDNPNSHYYDKPAQFDVEAFKAKTMTVSTKNPHNEPMPIDDTSTTTATKQAKKK